MKLQSRVGFHLNTQIMSKERIFSIQGTTVALADGQTRKFTVAAVLTEREVSDVVESYSEKRSANKLSVTQTYETIEHLEQTLKIGLAIVSPADAEIATAESGVTIAAGKARKSKSAILELTAKSKYFTKGVILNILEREASIISKNPSKFVHVSAPKKGDPQEVVSSPKPVNAAEIA